VSVPVNQIICGDNVETLRTLPDACVDSCVTDPPYGLEFMGKEWDCGVPGVELWREVLRVLKPGGHLLAFAGTRTQHRMAVAIEDAGFEIRDMIAWVYGSGFPKSLDVSKAIDAQDAVQEQQARRYQFTAWVRSTGVTSKQIDEATETNMGSHYTTAASQPAIMTREHLEACRHLLGEVPEWVERECDIRSIESQTLKNREVVGQKRVNGERGTAGGYANGIASVWGHNVTVSRTVNITAPATEAAKQWAGWGTSVRPALEPITWARKPLIGTVAANVLQHGTGAVNVDGCKVDGERLPANFIHDGSEEAVSLLGEADRFFYCAKADASERRQSKHPTIKPVALMRYLVRLVTPPGGLVLDPFGGSGTTAEAARLEHCRFLLMELSPEYCADAAERLRQGVLF
jgi:site-specific DNA-methyltransferase (adenine-specific)